MQAASEATEEKNDSSPETSSAELDPNVVKKITYEELDIGLEPDTLFEPWMMNTTVRERLGRRVQISGYICGAIFQLKNIREFPLLREVECPYGPGGQAHHAIQVVMRSGNSVDYSRELTTLEGKLTLKPLTGPNGKTWALYQLDDATRVP